MAKHMRYVDRTQRDTTQQRFGVGSKWLRKLNSDPLNKVVAARSGGPTGRADDDFGAKECRAAYDKLAGRK